VALDGLDSISINKEDLKKKLAENIPQKILYVAEAFRMSFSAEEILRNKLNIDPWFLNQVKEIVDIEKQITEKI
jgi:carbamoyl-phosphate synthase large subunit